MTVSFKLAGLVRHLRGYKLTAASLLTGSVCIGQTIFTSTSFAQDTTAESPAASDEKQANEKKPEEKPSSPASKEPYYNVIGEGKTLPTGVMRARIPFKAVSGTFGYDKDGNKVDMGFAAKALGAGLVFEYGISDKLSVQFLAPYIISSDLGVDNNEFRKSDLYKQKTLQFKAAVAAQLQAQGVCASDADCLGLIEGGFSFPQDTQLPLPNGEILSAKAGVPVKAYADSLVSTAATPASGSTGLGDVQAGVLYQIVNEGMVQFAIGGGFRFPTGKFTNVAASQRKTGRGTTDFGLRTNVDIHPTDGVILSWQNQAEVMIAKGKKKGTSLLDSDETYGSEKSWEREGVRHVGFLKAAVGWGLATQALSPFATTLSYDYDLDGETRVDGVTDTERSRFYTLTPGLGISGFPYSVPLTVDLEYSLPVGGKNVALATKTFSTTIKAYYRF